MSDDGPSAHQAPRTLLPRLDATCQRFATKRLAFVGGQGKSGTTWVERLIDAHPSAACLGEGHFAERLGRPLYQMLDAYNQYVTGNNQRFPELEDFPLFAAEDAIELAQALLLTQFSRIAERNADARVIAVRTPSELNWLRELSTVLPSARFVHVLRDPRDVALSLWWHGERLTPGRMLQEHGSLQGLASRLVPNWARHVEYVRETASQSGSALVEIRYERLHDQPLVEAARLFEFLDIEHDEATCSTCMEASSFARLSGRAAGQADVGSHFRIGLAGQWREVLPAAPAGDWPESVSRVLASLDYPVR